MRIDHPLFKDLDHYKLLLLELAASSELLSSRRRRKQSPLSPTRSIYIASKDFFPWVLILSLVAEKFSQRGLWAVIKLRQQLRRRFALSFVEAVWKNWPKLASTKLSTCKC